VLGQGKIPDASMCKVGSFTTLDLSGRYEVNKSLSFNFSVLNALNAGFPLDWATYGSPGVAPLNPSLHIQGAIGRSFNLGAVYKF